MEDFSKSVVVETQRHYCASANVFAMSSSFTEIFRSDVSCVEMQKYQMLLTES